MDFVQSCKEIVRKLRLPDWGDKQKDTQYFLCQWFDNNPIEKWLFVLDNADDLGILDELSSSRKCAISLCGFLPQDRYGALLVTTRDKRVGERLATRGKTITVSSMGMSEDIQLLKNYISATVAAEPHNLERLVQASEYLPLAITQAAAYATEKNITVENYLSVLEEGGESTQELLGKSLSDNRRDHPKGDSVIKTWKLSFEQIKMQEPRAAKMLSLMAMFDYHGIPAALLRHQNESSFNFSKSMGTLHNFSLVMKEANGETYKMHKLVQVSVQAWLEAQKSATKWRFEALSILAKKLPSGEYQT